MPAPKPTLSAKALADLLQVNRSAVFQWKDAGCPFRKGSKGFEFVVSEVVAWLEKRAEERGRKSAESQDGQSPYAQKQLADAEYRRIQIEQLRGSLIEVDVVREEYERFVGGFAAVATGRLQRFEREILQTTSPADARRLTQRMHAALMEGAQEYAAEIETTEDDEASEDESELGAVEDVA
jgi:hypothetical protein